MFAAKKEMSYQAMEGHGRTLNAYYQVSKAHLKRVHAWKFQLYDIVEKATMETGEISVVGRGLVVGGE